MIGEEKPNVFFTTSRIAQSVSKPKALESIEVGSDDFLFHYPSLGSCQSRFSSGWSLAQGKLQFDSGHLLDRMVFGSPQCVVRREISGEGRKFGVDGSINGTAAMRPCKDSFEYLLMELPTTFSSEDLRKILKEDTVQSLF
jgi:hypothetical protein